MFCDHVLKIFVLKNDFMTVFVKHDDVKKFYRNKAMLQIFYSQISIILWIFQMWNSRWKKFRKICRDHIVSQCFIVFEFFFFWWFSIALHRYVIFKFNFTSTFISNRMQKIRFSTRKTMKFLNKIIWSEKLDKNFLNR